MRRPHYICTIEVDENIELPNVSEGPEEVCATFLSEDRVSKLVSRVKIGEGLDPPEREMLLQLLERRQMCFPSSKRDIGHTNEVVH